MRTFLLITVTFACALMGWIVYTQTTSARGNKGPITVPASQPVRPDLGPYQFDAVAEEKREEATLAECDQKAATKQLGRDDRLAFIEKCLEAADAARPGPQR
jgi:hypothetical protein